MFYRKLFFLIFCFIVFGLLPAAFAQEYSFKNYTVDEGLPSPEVYCSLQDDKGYIWFGTDRGVCKFNGYNFETFTIAEGLAYNTVYGLYLDHRKRIWFLSNSNQLCYYKDNKVIQPPVNKALKSLFPNSVFRGIYCDTGDTIWLAVRGYGMVKITPANKIIVAYDNKNQVIKTFEDRSFISSGATQPQIIIDGPGKKSVLQLKENNHNPYSDAFVFMRSGASYFMAHGPFNHEFSVFTSSKVLFSQTLDYQIISAIEPSPGEFWFGSRSNGVYCYNGNNFSKPARRFLQHATVSSILKDKEGNFWFTTLEDGVYLLRTLNVLSYPRIDDADNNKYTAVFADKDNIWIGTDRGFTYKVDKKNAFFRYPPLSTPVLSFMKSNDNTIWLGSNSGNFKFTGTAMLRMYAPDDAYVTRLFKGPGGAIWGASGNRLYKYQNNNWIQCENKNPLANGYIDAISEDKAGVVWLGCNDGLWQYSSINKAFRKVKEIKVRIKDIKIPPDQCVWMASQGAGAILFKDNKFTYFNKKNGLLSNLCNSIYVDDEDNAWASTYRGLNCIKENKDKKHTITSITTVDGLISNEVLDCCRFNNKLWVFTGNGISYLDLKSLQPDTTLPRIHFTDIKINAQKWPLQSNYSLAHTENNITISYIGLYFKNAGNINYRYKLEGIDTGWTYTDNTDVQYGVLRPGKYKFLLEAQNNAGFWSKEPEYINITIHSPFWSTSWFIALVSALLLGGAYTVFNVRLKQIVKRENLNNELIQYKNNALQARMNPHFIFNSLNSINNYILQNDKLNSSKYLSKFASLMRFILDNSAKTNISLAAEIHGLQLYLELEKQRFKEKLNYEINIDPQLNPSTTKVPALILQPFVENAILHGILPKTEPGLIKINISKNHGSVLCVIEDNGVGRPKNTDNGKKKSPGHVSNGIQVTQERLQLLNRVHKERTELTITDLADKNGNPAGTRVELLWPLIKE